MQCFGCKKWEFEYKAVFSDLANMYVFTASVRRQVFSQLVFATFQSVMMMMMIRHAHFATPACFALPYLLISTSLLACWLNPFVPKVPKMMTPSKSC